VDAVARFDLLATRGNDVQLERFHSSEPVREGALAAARIVVVECRCSET
jgi:hypothetical protein